MQGFEAAGEIYNVHYAPEPDFAEGAVHFFRVHLELTKGRYACLLQLQLPDGLRAASVRLQAIDGFTRAILAELRLEASLDDLEALDDPILNFELDGDTLVEFVGSATGLQRAPMLRYLRLLRLVGGAQPTRASFRDDRSPFQTEKLSIVLVGGTNHCNASCPHCPANKPMLADMPLGVMSSSLLEKLLDGLRDVELELGFWFGVFGEPFLDDTLETKLEMLRRRRPDAEISISTNAAAIDLKRAVRIFELVTRLQIHAEAITPARYDALMHPLRATDVLPKIDALVDAFPGRIQIIAPLHRGNITETDLFAERWGAKGVRIQYAQFLNRSASRTGANKLALWPTPGFWRPDLVDALTVDWDGTVLALCDDFLRRQPLGSLARETLPEILSGAARRTLHEDLSCFRWARLPSMRDATVDSSAKVREQTQRHDGNVTRRRKFHQNAFKIRADVRNADDLLTVEPPSPGAGRQPIVYGPYLTLPEGRYCVEIDASVHSGAPRALIGEVLAYGHKIYHQCVSPGGSAPLRISFTHDRADMPIEFRLFVEDFRESVTLAFRGATLFKVA